MPGTETNKLILGTAQLGLEYGINNKSGKPSKSRVKDILDLAYESGIRILDGAEAYGDALETIAAYHRESKHKFQLIIRFDGSEAVRSANIKARITKHLTDQGISSLYAFMYHSLSDLQKFYPLHAGDLQSLRAEGKFHRIGVSVYTNREFETAIEDGLVDLIQVPFNVLDNMLHRRELFEMAGERNIEVHVRSAFLQGLLLKDPSEYTGKLSLLAKPVEQAKQIAEKAGISMEELCLLYAVQQPLISKVVIGTETPDQLKANVAALKKQIHPDTLLELDQVKVMCNALLNPARWKKGFVLAITQARTGSTRLPAKVLKTVSGKALLEIHLERLAQSERIDHLIVATTTEPADVAIEELCIKVGVECFRGSNDDVLSRYFHAAQPFNPDWVVRITSDCPLIDASLMDELIDKAMQLDVDYCSNTLAPTYPNGFDVEVFKFSALKKAMEEATLRSDREHVTPFIHRNSSFNGQKPFESVNVKCEEDLSGVRLTIDEPNDYEVMKAVIEALGSKAAWRTYADYYLSNKELMQLNNYFDRNEGYQKSLQNDNK